ncbi:hypothetical protein [Thiohalorhabdus methylotrophus]|uniref:Mechanosensitive ion channel n=1 Tax=Thiohalorhabdus methylotrophus TaxID=3242694 RepID=A0ABV4TVD9_9GAMM
MIGNIVLALVVLLVFWSLSRSMPVVLGGWVGRLAGKTATRLDDHLVAELDGATGRVVMAVGLWLAWEVLLLEGLIGAVVATVLLLGVVFTTSVLAFEAASAAFTFFADPHEERGREMVRAFETRFQRMVGTLVALAGTAFGLAVLGADPLLVGAVFLTVGLVGALAVQPALQELNAGLDLIRSAGWRPGMRIIIGEFSGKLLEISPAAIALETHEGRGYVSNTRALGAALVQDAEQEG